MQQMNTTWCLSSPEQGTSDTEPARDLARCLHQLPLCSIPIFSGIKSAKISGKPDSLMKSTFLPFITYILSLISGHTVS